MAEATSNEEDKKNESLPTNRTAEKTNQLLLIVIIVLTLLLVGGGAAAFLIYRGAMVAVSAQQQDETPADGAAQAAKAKEPEKKKPPKKEKEGPKAPAIYVALEPPFVMNFVAGKPAKFLQVTMELMTRDPNTAQILKDNNPMLRNDLLTALSSQPYETVAAPDGKEVLRAAALEAVRGVVKREGGKPTDVEAVYFSSVVMQ